MLQDQSEDFHDTWEFLDNRMEDVKKVGKTISQVRIYTTDSQNPTSIIPLFTILVHTVDSA